MDRWDWDPAKAEANRRKHGITFEEAVDMLDRDRSFQRPDVAHSAAEDRVRTLGLTSTGTLIVVIASTSGPRPRIISARRATKREHDEFVGRRF